MNTGPLPPIPLTIVTGFLGSGKTTLLNRLLADPRLADTVVIVNEFGEIGLDHLLIEKVDDEMLLLAAGCLCCTVRGDLVRTLEDLLRKRDNGRIAPFRRVVIETTGLADPAPVIAAVLHHPYLSLRYAVSSIVTLIDAVLGGATLDRHEEARRQVAVADRLVLTKADLTEDADALGRLQARLRTLNPGASLRSVEAIGAGIIADEGLFAADGKIADVAGWLRAAAVEEAHAHHHHGGHHHHDVNRHDARIQAVTLTAERPIGQGALDMFLDILRSSFGPRILRLKGLVCLAERPDEPVVLHGVAHVLHVPGLLPAWPDGDRRTRLVLILDDVEPEAVRRMWGAFSGVPAIDAPDAAALVNNPLAPPTMAKAR